MPANKRVNKKTGSIGEQIAATFLKNKGFSIVACNYRRKYGEIDIIAQKGSVIHFVEVKSVTFHVKHANSSLSRVTSGYRPEELVHPYKLRKISRVAEEYMAGKPEDLDYQIDVVAVFIDMERKVGRCRLTENVS